MNKDINDNLSWLFLQVSFRAKQGLIKLAEQHELSVVQMYTLCSMQPDKPLQMNEIAQMLACDPSNVTGIIDRLFVGEFIQRREGPKDRRVKMISLTSSGARLREQLFEAIMQSEPASFQHLSAAQKTQLHDLLVQILHPEMS